MTFRQVLFLTFAMLPLSAFAADTPSTPKKTTGVIKKFEPGDVACYVELSDDQGKSFTEMAVFEICEKTQLIGKKVKLTYTKTQVIAESCQGDPECTKHDTAELISEASLLTP